jgi:hypothetical protein
MRVGWIWPMSAGLGAAALGLFLGSCGGNSPTQPAPSPTPISSSTPSPTPAPSPTPTPTPSPSATCNLAPGPVTRYAIAPRAQVTDGVQVPIRVRARSGFDEVRCLDKSKSHRLDFNSNQRNADNKECCWINEPVWRIVDDPQRIVTSGAPLGGSSGFNYRVRVDPEGKSTSFSIEAEVDGVVSYPWQSGSGYRQEPFQVVTMSASDITKECTCEYLGNGLYTPDPKCPK